MDIWIIFLVVELQLAMIYYHFNKTIWSNRIELIIRQANHECYIKKRFNAFKQNIRYETLNKVCKKFDEDAKILCDDCKEDITYDDYAKDRLGRALCTKCWVIDRKEVK